MSKAMPYRKRVSPVPGILIDLTMIANDGAFVSIEYDDNPEVFSIYLPAESFVEFAEHINDAVQHMKIPQENG